MRVCHLCKLICPWLPAAVARAILCGGLLTTSASADESFPRVAGQHEPSLEVVADLRCDRLLQEPIVANPLHLSFDERGRLWVVQYRQYPWPAGLKLLSHDNVWRNVYSPPFAPPPPHALESPFRGHDRVSIHEDTDADGQFDRHKVFVDGLNFATAALPGRGGVFVLNPPYLLFYSDQDKDDVPDAPQPKILLSGFGIEDSHSIANSLRWGPDGWIYATQGSTVSAAIVMYDDQGQPINGDRPVHSMGQNVWRYHPTTHRYEVFAEGGGNAFGVEIDAEGRIYSGHNGGDTRGFYYVQGGYSQKNFGKHGDLSNPYAFAYYGPMRHHPVVRFTHTFCIYEADGLPSRYQGRLFGVNPVEHDMVLSTIGPDGSSRQTSDLAVIVKPTDAPRANWFTPVDVQLGPDGAVYVADWYSVQPNHYRNHEGQTNPDLGRVYRLRTPEANRWQPQDLSRLSSNELVNIALEHPNRWYRQTAKRLLGDRRDSSVVPRLYDELHRRNGLDALEALWALHLSGEWNESLALEGLAHPVASVRRWTIRLLGDEGPQTDNVRQALLACARGEADVEVRLQLAASARRFDTPTAVNLAYALYDRNIDHADPYVPNMIWWAIEAHANETATVLQPLTAADRWDREFRVGGASLSENLLRRYAMRGQQADLQACAQLLKLAPRAELREALARVFESAFAGRPLPPLPADLSQELARVEGPYAQLLLVRQQQPAACAQALQAIEDATTPVEQRVELMRALSDVRALPDRTVPALLRQLERESPSEPQRDELQRAAVQALQKFADAQIGRELLQRLPKLVPAARSLALSTLASRADWAVDLMSAVDDARVPSTELAAEVVDRLRRYTQSELAASVARHFPPTTLSNSQLDERINAIESIVLQGQGDPLAGRELFKTKATCAKCHRIYSQGGAIGPDLTSYNRSDLRRMLLAIVNPSAEIREGFANFTVETVDGRVLSGLKVEQNDNLVVLRGGDGQDQVIAASEIDSIAPSPQSLMPHGLLDALSDDEIRNLFAFLTSTTPPL